MSPIELARAGDAAGLRAWVAGGGDPNAPDAEGWTPLLWAAVRGHEDAVAALLDAGADPRVGHALSAALPIHMAGQSGNVACARLLLDREPAHLDAVWDLNGHTVLLQAVFYEHLELATFLVGRGADTAITTARGLGPKELAAQFQNAPLVAAITPFDKPAEAKAAYYASYLKRIAPVVPPGEEAAQATADRLNQAIADGLKSAATDPTAVESTLVAVKALVEGGGADPNRKGGPLGQPALIVAVTGNNGFPTSPDLARLRLAVATYLLEHGADPTAHEDHPMGAQTIIRASVFNHLQILRACAERLSPQKMADAINEIPLVNGLTALHDNVLRATTADPVHFEGYLAQAAFFMDHGGRSDLEDYAGQTQRDVARKAHDPEVRRRLLAVLDPSSPS